MPEKVFRCGVVSGSIFSNEVGTASGTRTLRSVSLQRRIKNGDDVKYLSSFGLGEIPQAMAVLQMCQRYVEEHEAEVILD